MLHHGHWRQIVMKDIVLIIFFLLLFLNGLYAIREVGLDDDVVSKHRLRNLVPTVEGIAENPTNPPQKNENKSFSSQIACYMKFMSYHCGAKRMNNGTID